MPDKLKAHSNERVDLVDFILAANDYTSSTNAFDKERTWLDGRSRILEGFYVEISDQTSTPGQITIYNGTGLDREGNILNDESLANSATTITLAGASQSFYVEIELTSSESATDSRAFWDPTVVNTVPIPNGGEVNINVPTRITPNWQVVYPISTSGFSVTTNPNSNRVPIALLNTNGSNQITNAVNTYGSLVNASTKSEVDVAAAAGSVRVIDSKLFTIGSQFTFDLGGTNPETSLTVTANDLDNNIISFTPGLSFAHNAGAIVRQTGVTARFLPQTLDPNDPTFTAVLPTGRPNDQERRMFQGDETRGSAFLASKSTYGARNDLDIRTLKDEVDFLAAMVRDMKFGHPRVDVTSDAPPSSFSSRPRYYDDVGGIAGARTAYVTVGNGTTTFGDFNGTSQTPFIAAANALPANGGTIYVKPGTYTFTAAWAPSKPNVNVVGDGRLSTIISNNNASEAITISGGIIVNFSKLTVVTGTGSSNVCTVAASTVSFTDCEVDGIVGTSAAAIIGDRTDFNRSITATSVEDCVFTRCNFTANSSIAGTFVNCLFDSCEWTCTATAFTVSGASSNVRILNSSIVNTTTDVTTFSTTAPVTNVRISNTNFIGRNTGGTVSCVHFNENTSDVVLDGCTFYGSFVGVTADSAIVRLANTSQNITFNNCLFSEVTPGTGATGLSRTAGTGNSIRVENCSFTGCHNFGIRAFNGSSTNGFFDIVNCSFASSNFGNYIGIYLSEFSPTTRITDCKFNSFSGLGTPTLYDIFVSSAANISNVYVSGNTFTDYTTNGFLRPVAISSSSINSFLEVTENTFTTGGNNVAGTGTYRGVSIAGATCTVKGNTFKNITATGTGTIACVYNNSNPSDVKLAVRDNLFCRMSTANGTLRAVDVLYGNADDSVSIENNTAHDITIAVTSPLGLFSINHVTSTDTTHKLLFVGNTVTNCQLGTGGGCYVLRCSYGGSTVANNTMAELTAPGSSSLAALGFGDCTSLNISNNNINILSSANDVYGISLFSGSPLSTISDNKINNLTSSAAIAAGIYTGGAFSGNFTSNYITNANGSTFSYSLYMAAFSNATVASNYFSSVGSGTIREVSSTSSCTNTVFSNNVLTRGGSSLTADGIYIPVNSIDSLSVIGNTAVGYRVPIHISTAPSASITGNIIVTDNTIDSKTMLIPNFTGIYVGIDVSSTGFFRGITVNGNTVRKADDVSASCIRIEHLGVPSTAVVTGISVSNNRLFETGSALTSVGYMIRLFGTVAGGVIAFQDVVVNNNTINSTANTGTRTAAVIFAGCTRATMNGNNVFWLSGGQDALQFAVAYGTCTGNMVETDSTTFAFDASGGSNTLLVGNQTNRTGGAAVSSGFTNTASNF